MIMGIFGGLGLLVCALVVYGSTKGAASGSVPRNGGAGIRTRTTQLSDRSWVAAHTAALPKVRVLSVGISVVGVLLILAGALSDAAQPSRWVLTLFGVGYLALSVGLWWVVRVANRAAIEAAR